MLVTELTFDVKHGDADPERRRKRRDGHETEIAGGAICAASRAGAHLEALRGAAALGYNASLGPLAEGQQKCSVMAARGGIRRTSTNNLARFGAHGGWVLRQ